jgi:hypothetical protein
VAGEDRTGQAGEANDVGAAPGQVPGVPDELVAAAGEAVAHPTQSPLYHAENADRYDRQALIKLYQGANSCRLIVMIDMIFAYSVTLFEELLYDANPDQDLHLMLASPGGDGETAVRLVRSAQARCRELTVIVPDQAKSAATVLALGAHHILMGPTSDLGPIDPQFQMGGGLVAAKDIIAAVEAAEAAIEANPQTYTLHAALLADVTALQVQQARSALARSEDQMREALKSNPDRDEAAVVTLCNSLREPLITSPKSHGATLGADDATQHGLPVRVADPIGDQWKIIWRLWTKYFARNQRAYEGERTSKLLPWPQG